MISISDFLKFDEPRTLEDLCSITGLKERQVRHLIEEERQVKKDFVIVSSSHSKGYYKTKDPDKIKGYLEEQEHRARKIFYNLRGANLFLGNLDQPQLGGVQ